MEKSMLNPSSTIPGWLKRTSDVLEKNNLLSSVVLLLAFCIALPLVSYGQNTNAKESYGTTELAVENQQASNAMLQNQNQKHPQKQKVVFPPPTEEKCGFVYMEKVLQEMYPNRKTTEEFEEWMQYKIANGEYDASRAIKVIPVVVHVIHNGEDIGVGANISVEQVESQIDVMNEDFRRLNADASNTPDVFEDIAVDAEITFCLATVTPDGEVTNGINRYNGGQNSFTVADMETDIKPATIWNPEYYFNIWVCKLTPWLGYAQFPDDSGLPGLPPDIDQDGTEETDGIVIKTTSFGTTGTATPPFDLGRTATHEAGHFFGLRHIWGDKLDGSLTCDNDDYCDDTPRQFSANYTGSPCTFPGPNSCDEGADDLADQFMNFMDYSDDVCMNMFTEDQKTRFDVVFSNSPRRNFELSQVCDGVPPPSDDPLSATASATDVSCNGGADGTIELVVTGGTPPYTFLWSDGATTEDRTGLTAGTYSVDVTDAAGDMTTAEATVNEPPAIIVSAYETADYNGFGIRCFGLTGNLTCDVSGGTPPYSYLWTPSGITTQTAQSLTAGTYQVEITDANGCTATASTDLTQPPDLTSTFTLSVYNGFNISCFGESDGWAEAFPSGGVPGYTYLWGDGQTNAKAINLSAGNLAIQISDANSCTYSSSVDLTEPPLLEADITGVSYYNGYNISCHGGNDGWLTVTANGGVAPFTYLWSDGQTAATATNLTAGDYSVTITDANGCEATSLTVTLTEPDPLTIDAGANQTVYYGYPPAECATISWSGEGGGVPPYTISWNDGGSQTHEVCPGEFTTTYTVTITDKNGCSATDEVTVCVIDVRCGKKLDKVELCHVPEDNPANEHTICVSVNAVAEHLAHGDMLGACGTYHGCDDPKTAPLVSTLDTKYETRLNAYPNPFGESTTIAFSSGVEGQITIQLFDFTGRLIKELFEGEAELGTEYKIRLDADRLSPGINFCVLRHSDGTVIINKLILHH
jgi:hypothetical protein